LKLTAGKNFCYFNFF